MSRRVYCDSSVLLKRFLVEEDSRASVSQLNEFTQGGDHLFASRIAVVEVTRGVDKRMPAEATQEAFDQALNDVLGDVDIIAIDDFTLQLAAEIPGRHLGSLDAIHVATALIMRADLVVTRDQRMMEACAEVGLAVA